MGEAIKGLVFGTIAAGLTLWAILSWGPVVIPPLAEFGTAHPALFWLICGALIIYFIPTIIAVGRGRENAAAIVALNLFLGWTLLGWLGSLIWALTTPKHETPAIRASFETVPPVAPSSSADVVEKLAKAAELHSTGRLSDEEFSDLKRRLLASS